MRTTISFQCCGGIEGAAAPSLHAASPAASKPNNMPSIFFTIASESYDDRYDTDCYFCRSSLISLFPSLSESNLPAAEDPYMFTMYQTNAPARAIYTSLAGAFVWYMVN